MNRSSRSLALAALVSALWLLPQQAHAAGEAFAQAVDPQQARALMQQGDHLHTVDLRPRRDFLQGTLPGAVHLDWEQLVRLVPEPEAELLLIGVPAAADMAELRHYRRVYVLQGGIAAWREAGFALVKPRETKPAFVIPRGLCEMNEPAMRYPAEPAKEQK